MKAIIGIFIASMFGLELMSPFMVGYLNDKDVSIKKHASKASNSNRKIKKCLNASEYSNSPASAKNDSKVCQNENANVNNEEEISYSDSKSLIISDDNSAFTH